DAWSGLQGTLCFGNITPPASNTIFVGLNDGASEELTVTFAGPPSNPATLNVTPSTINLRAADASSVPQSTVTVNLSDNTSTWTVSIYPANRTTSWLTASQF